MVKFLTMALGGLTALAVAGLATPSGQAMLGTHQALPAIPVSVISDPGPLSPINVTAPAATPVSTAPGVPAPAPVVSERHVSAPVAQVARPVYRPTARRIYRPAASAPVAVAHSVPTPAGLSMGGAGGIGSIMQLLPSMLQQGAPVPSQYGYGYGPAPASQAAPAPAWGGGNQGNQGDGPEHH
jgi:hypothetical protein